MRITFEEIEEVIRELLQDFVFYPSNRAMWPTEVNIIKKMEELNEVELTPEEIDDVMYLLNSHPKISECNDTLYFV